MAQDPNEPNIVVKQTPTTATYTRAGVAAGGVATLPFGFQSLILTINETIHAIWANVPIMSDDRALSLGILLTALPTFWAAFSIRGTKFSESD